MRYLLAVLLLAVAGLTNAQSIGVKGLDLGMTQREVVDRFDSEVDRAHRTHMREKIAQGEHYYLNGVNRLDDDKRKLDVVDMESNGAPFTLAGHKVTALVLYDVDKTVKGFRILFMPNQYDDMKTALLTKYVLNCSSSSVGNAMGAVFQNEICTFESNVGKLFLQKYNGKITEGILLVAAKADVDAIRVKNAGRKNDI